MPIFRSQREVKVTPKLAREVEAERPKKFLVLGSEGHARGVTAYRWDKVPEGINVADYDVVIVNFAAFDDKELAAGYPLHRLPTREAFARLIFAPKSEIVAIGRPDRLIGRRVDGSGPWDPRKRSDYFMPCWLGIEDDRGDSYRVLAEEWQPYFDHLSGWEWIASGSTSPYDHDPRSYLGPVTSEATQIAVQLEPLAETRFEKAVALKIHLMAFRVVGATLGYLDVEARGGTPEVVAKASPIIWLPKPDRLPVAEAIDLILRERYGLGQVTRLPEWALSYSLPDELEIQREIERLEEERRDVESRISDARQRALDAASPRALLFEKGKDALEPVVRDALRRLGGRVEDPEAEGIEDGLLFHGEDAAVIEIKGRKNQIKQDDVRQVVQWAADAKLRDGVSYKAVIVGNPNCDLPIGDRGDPLAPNALQYAERGEVALVTTAQIYEALRQQQRGDFDEGLFWERVFGASGNADLAYPPPPANEPPDAE
jgi:hypothetical protein